MQKDKDAAEPQGERKPYEKPRIEESGQFEHLVLTCGFRPGQPGPCAGQRANSTR
jgi:hypothetical protein